MIDSSLLFTLALAAALGCGLMSGVFFVFSVAVMKALGRLPANTGMRAMQSINTSILNSTFLAAFMGTTLLCAAVAVWSVLRLGFSGSRFLLVGALAFLGGAFVVTGTRNVPMNESLDRVTSGAYGSEQIWTDYLARWTAWNHVRAAASFAAALLLTLGLAL